MDHSISRSPSVQPHPIPTTPRTRYVATHGVELVEEGLTLDWIIDRVQERSRHLNEDVALWHIDDADAAWIVAVVHQGGAGLPVVVWL